MTVLASKTIDGKTYEVVADDECSIHVYGLNNFTKTDHHQGGVTIKNTDTGEYYIPDYNLAELTSQYAKQGRDNPSSAAYESLQRELMRAFDAGMYSVISYDGECTCCADVIDSIGFDYSYNYDSESLESMALEIGLDHKILPDGFEF